MRFPTASNLERALACPRSVLLPKVYEEGPWALAGTDLHNSLKAHTTKAPYPAEHSAWAEACVEAVGDMLTDAATLREPAYVYVPEWGRGELLGLDLGRNYGTAPSRGYCGAADYVRTRGDAVEVLDLKTGYGEVAPPGDNAQLLLLALAAACLHDAKRVRVGLLLAPIDSRPVVEWADVSWDRLESFGARLDMLAQRLRAARKPEDLPVTDGPHCRYCKSRAACPVQAQREKEALALPQASRLVVDESNAGEVWAKVDAAKAVLDELKTACIQVALRAGGVRMPDGKLRRQVTRETEALEPEVVWRELVRLYGPEVAKAGVTLEASKASVLRGVKAAREAGATGSAAALQREVLEAVRAAGGVETKQRHEWVDE